MGTVLPANICSRKQIMRYKRSLYSQEIFGHQKSPKFTHAKYFFINSCFTAKWSKGYDSGIQHLEDRYIKDKIKYLLRLIYINNLSIKEYNCNKRRPLLKMSMFHFFIKGSPKKYHDDVSIIFHILIRYHIITDFDEFTIIHVGLFFKTKDN